VLIWTMLGTLVTVSLLTAPPAGAQPRTAEVRTWDGQVLRVEEPMFRVFYTIAPPPREGDALPQAEKPQAAGRGEVGIMASVDALKGLGETRAAVSVQDHRPLHDIPLHRGAVETLVPVERLASLTFGRQPVAASTLPPYVRPMHVRHSAVAVLTDGSRVEADYVNLGLTVLRGTTHAGRVDVRWDDLESIRFTQ
jgi:hypothetical protein